MHQFSTSAPMKARYPMALDIVNECMFEHQQGFAPEGLDVVTLVRASLDYAFGVGVCRMTYSQSPDGRFVSYWPTFSDEKPAGG